MFSKYEEVPKEFFAFVEQVNSNCAQVNLEGACFMSTRTLSVGIWYHVAMVFEYRESGLQFFINGKFDSSHSPSSKIVSNSYG
jgi:hypothetical protein